MLLLKCLTHFKCSVTFLQANDILLCCMQVRRQRGVVLDRVAELMQQGLFQQPVAEEIGLEDFQQALRRQIEGHLPGKTLLKLGL